MMHFLNREREQFYYRLISAPKTASLHYLTDRHSRRGMKKLNRKKPFTKHPERPTNPSPAAPSTDLLLLPNPMGSGLGLQVILGVPVRVEDDHCVRGSQVDSQATSPCGEQETEVLYAMQHTALCRRLLRQLPIQQPRHPNTPAGAKQSETRWRLTDARGLVAEWIPIRLRGKSRCHDLRSNRSKRVRAPTWLSLADKQ